MNSLKRTIDGAGRPAAWLSPSGQSSGQGLLPCEVIMAMTEWPAGVSKAVASDKTKAGRFFVVLRSVKGNGVRELRSDEMRGAKGKT